MPRFKGIRYMEYLNHVLKKRSIVFVISDFLDKDWERALKVTGRKHDLIAIPVRDAGERELADVGWVVFEDAETGDVFLQCCLFGELIFG